MLTMFGRLGVDWPWCDPLKEETFFGALSNILDLNALIRGVMLTRSWEERLLRVVLLQKSAVDRHHERIAVWSYEAICSIWVDWHYYKWSFPFGLKLSFFVLWVMTMGLLTVKTRSPFLKIRSLSYWKLWRSKLDRARFFVGLADVCRLKLPTLGGAVNVFPHLPSWLSRQLAEMGFRSLVKVQLHIRTLRKMA